MSLFLLTLGVLVGLLLLFVLAASVFIAVESPYGLTRYEHDRASLVGENLRPERALAFESRAPFLLRESVAASMVAHFGNCTGELDRRGVQWWAVGATLLGAVRHRGLVPFCDRMEIALLRKDLARILCADSPLSAVGLAIGRSEHGYSIWRADSELRFPCVDVSVVEVRSGELALGTPLDELGNCTFADAEARPLDVFPAASVFPLREARFMGRDIPIPAKPEACLDIAHAGADWRAGALKQGYQHIHNRLTRGLWSRLVR